MNIITRAEAWKKIEATNGKIFGAKVIKRMDGTKRTFNCRLSRTVQKGKSGGFLPYNATKKNLVTVYEIAADREAKDKYRQLNMEGLYELSIDGEKFMVN